ncbi:MAG: dTMP kinase [Candidatus Tectomicrobia bacterium]|nr:dTMP kinase [Candidatus Tectomicrobia bacterium]
MPGAFITFEGIEHSGKTTQTALLARRLEDHGICVERTREPGGTALGDSIREVVLDPAHEGMDPIAELLLMEAARAEHVARRVRPALEAGRVILCDRFTDSTLAYQVFGRGLDRKKVEELNDWVTGGLRPDATLLFDLDVAVGLQRANRLSGHGPNQVRFEMEDVVFHERVRAGFLQLAEEDPGRIKVVRATGTPAEVHERVWRALEKTLEAVAPCG